MSSADSLLNSSVFKMRSQAALDAAEALQGPLKYIKDQLIETEMSAIYTLTLALEEDSHKQRALELRAELKTLRFEEIRLLTYVRLYQDWCSLDFAIGRYCKAHQVQLLTPTRPEYLTLFQELRAELAENVAQRTAHLVAPPPPHALISIDHAPYYAACLNQVERAGLFGLVLWSKEHIATQRAHFYAGLL